MKKHMNKIFIIFLCITFFLIFSGGGKINLVSLEDLDIYVGIGLGIKRNGEDNIIYRSSNSSNSYKEDESIQSILTTGTATTIGKTREDRQHKIGKKFFLGLSKVYILDEEYARYGIRGFMDINFKNPVVNDNAFLAVCKGNHEDYFTHISPDYDNSAEFISDMIKNASNYNFFKNDYMIKNASLSMDAEGKNVICPYIQIKENQIKIAGMAVFKKDKLACILDINDTKIMNMLRENKVKGILTIQDQAGKYVNYEAESKRKIKCSKIGDNYTFIIDLDLNGDIISNILYKDMSGKIAVTKAFEKDMSKQVKEMCTEFLSKMQNEYKVDCLQLGWVAAGKYGRDTGVDWNDVVSKSIIKVNVKVNIDKIGRGEY